MTQMPTVPPNRVIREGDVPPRRMPPPAPPDTSNPGRDVRSAPRYRIVTNGTVFRVQRRIWLFWRDCMIGPWRSSDHDTIDEARRHLRGLEKDDARSRRHWAVVS